jgi:elongation factor G
MNNGLSRSFYRETVRDSGVADEKIIRQRGGMGVYAHVRVAVHALSRGQGTEFAWGAGLNIPARFASSVIQGLQDAMDSGVLAGLEMTDVHASIESGSYHEEDSTADAFREAAEKATAEALRRAHPIILEALSSVSITVPEEFIAAVEATVASYHGQVATTQSETPLQSVKARLPASHAGDLIAELLRISDGHARISIAPAGFRPKPEPPDTIEQWVARK